MCRVLCPAEVKRGDDELKARQELYGREVTEWGNADLLGELTRRYAPSEIPPCRVCGKPLAVQSIGGGPTGWACSGQEPDPENPERWRWAEGRRPADEHYLRSQWKDHRQGGDELVMELVRRFERGR